MATLNNAEIHPQLIDGLTVYELGHGIGQDETVLLLPDPAQSAAAASAGSNLALLLVRLGKRVITFDPPTTDLIGPALISLDALCPGGSADVVTWGHMARHALFLAQSHPDRVTRLALIGDLPTGTEESSWHQIAVPLLIYLGETGPSTLARAHTLAEDVPGAQVIVNFEDGPNPIDHAPIHVGAALRTFLEQPDPRPGKIISVEI